MMINLNFMCYRKEIVYYVFAYVLSIPVIVYLSLVLLVDLKNAVFVQY